MVTHVRCVGVALIFALVGWSLVAAAAGPELAPTANPDSLAWWADRLTGTGGLGLMGLLLGRMGGIPIVVRGYPPESK